MALGWNLRPRLAGAALAALTLTAGCRREAEGTPADKARPDGSNEAAPAGESAATSKITVVSNGWVRVALRTGVAERLGVTSAALESQAVSDEALALGRIVDPSALALLDNDLADAEAAANVSEIQADRTRRLFKDWKAVSQHAVENAETLLRTERTRLTAARRRLELDWGVELARATGAERQALVDRLLRREIALARVELPAGAPLATVRREARVSLPGEDGFRAATVFAEATVVDVRTQGRAFLLEIAAPGPRFRPGAAVEAWLAGPGSDRRGWRLPASALVRNQGRTWVYLDSGGGAFDRAEVDLLRPGASGDWLSLTALPDGARVVTVGAQGLLSEELKGRLGGD